jgi:hypothetical protein
VPYTVDLTNFPEAFKKQYAGLSEARQQTWRDERYRALTDHLYLSREVMGMDFQEIPHKWLFQVMLKKSPGTPLYDLDLKKKKRMILWSRGLFKTSGVIVEIIQLILNYPNIRICFLSGSDGLARLQLDRVRRFFEQPTKKFRELFPEFIGDDIGSPGQFTVPCRTNTTFAEPTFKISTARSVKASQHFDVIFVDDLVNDTNYHSQKLLQKCIQAYKDICPLLAPDGFMYVTGTRYSFGDLYEDIQELAQKEIAELGTNPWIFSIKSCWVRICATCGHKDAEHDFDSDLDGPCAMDCGCRHFVDSGARSVLFPKFRCEDGRTEGHTVEFLQSEKIRLGSEMFACQYENSPLAEGEQTFTDELIGKQTVWHQNQFPTALQAPCFVMGDLSYVGDEKRDSSVLMVVRWWGSQLFVVDCVHGKWDSMQIAQELFKIMLKHRPSVVWLEKFPAWETYNTVFEFFARDHKLQKLPIEWKKVSNVKDAKLVRIGSIKGFLVQRRLWIFGHIPGYDILCTQLKRWPKLGKHDDHADCLGLVCECPTGLAADALPPPPKDGTALSFIRSLHQNDEVEAAYDTRIPGTY